MQINGIIKTATMTHSLSSRRREGKDEERETKSQQIVFGGFTLSNLSENGKDRRARKKRVQPSV